MTMDLAQKRKRGVHEAYLFSSKDFHTQTHSELFDISHEACAQAFTALLGADGRADREPRASMLAAAIG